MPSWTQVLHELQTTATPFDIIRRKYLKSLHEHTGRNVIAYYSGWLQKQHLAVQGVGFSLDEIDKSAFMTTIYGLDRKLGLDLLLHTPGGSITALEGLVFYLRQMFGTDIRAIVPQIAMSAGTMLALSCKEIVLGKHSSLGPIDPQLYGLPAHGIIEELTQAKNEIQGNPQLANIWVPIISKYQPTMIGAAEKAIRLADDLVTKWIETNMFAGEDGAADKAKKIVKHLGHPTNTLTHDRRVSVEDAIELGIKVTRLEADSTLQDLVLSTHHAFTTTLSETTVVRITENHNGIAHMLNYRQEK